MDFLSATESYETVLVIYAVAAVATFVALWFIDAPYGRHMREGFGPSINANLGWVIMEGVALVAMPVFAFLTSPAISPVFLFLVLLWIAHYGNRALIYPWQRRKSGKKMPLMICLTAVLFNLMNCYANGLGLAVNAELYDIAWLSDPRFLGGVALFYGGAFLNLHSDAVFLKLRRQEGAAQDGYYVPDQGLHRYVAAPNYLGELIQWGGWALLSWSLAGLMLTIYTFANLAPRAVAHLRWYRETFPDYPRSRKALIPFIW